MESHSGGKKIEKQVSIRKLNLLLEESNPNSPSNGVHTVEGNVKNELEFSNCLCERIFSLYNNKLLSDTVFILCEEQEEHIFYAHSCILATVSEPFQKLLSGPFKESNERKHGKKMEVKIPNIKKSTFEQVLGFLYGGKIKLSKENVFQVLSMSDQYDISKLKEYCSQYLSKYLEVSTVCQMAQASTHYGLPDIVDKCVHVIEQHGNKIFKSKEIAFLPKEIFKTLLSSNKLNVDEYNVFRGVVRWCKHQAGEEEHKFKEFVLELIHLVRFSLMEAEVLKKEVRPLGIVPNEVLLDAYENIAMGTRARKRGTRMDVNFRWSKETRGDNVELSNEFRTAKNTEGHQSVIALPEITSNICQWAIRIDALRDPSYYLAAGITVVPEASTSFTYHDCFVFCSFTSHVCSYSNDGSPSHKLYHDLPRWQVGDVLELQVDMEKKTITLIHNYNPTKAVLNFAPNTKIWPYVCLGPGHKVTIV